MHHESITNSTFQDTRKLLKLWNYTSAATKGQLYILSSTPLQITRYRIRSVRMHRYCDAGYYKCTSKCIYIYIYTPEPEHVHAPDTGTEPQTGSRSQSESQTATETGTGTESETRTETKTKHATRDGNMLEYE